MAANYFCPKCWQRVDEREHICPYCSYDLSEYADLPYEDKLICALQHPIRENKMIAIQLLGDLQNEEALPVFASIIETEEDYYILREIIHSLEKIESPESMLMIRRLRMHKSALVRTEAARIFLNPDETFDP